VTRLRDEQPKIRSTYDFSSSSKRQNRLWDPPSLLFEGYVRLFPRGENGRTVKMTTHFHLIQRLRMFGASYRQRHTTSSRVTQWRVPLYARRPIHFATVRSLRDYRDCRGTDESFALLGCYAGHVSSYSPMFRDRLSVSSSSSRKSKTSRNSGHVSFINNTRVSNCSHSREESKAPEIS